MNLFFWKKRQQDKKEVPAFIADLERYVKEFVAAGFLSEDEIVEAAIECVSGEAEPETMRSHAVLLTKQALADHFAGQAKWSSPTDCDRLDAAFAELEESGIVSRQNFSCCQNCGSYEIGDEMRKRFDEGLPVRGYTFYHQQDTESAVEGFGLCFAYGSTEEPVESSIAIGNEICNVLRKHDLKPEWDGSIKKRISLRMEWKRRRVR